jgi:hypothetical protein
MTVQSEFHGKRRRNYTASGPKPAPVPEPAAPVVEGGVTLHPLTRYTVVFQVPDEPKDLYVALLEARVKQLEYRIAVLEGTAPAEYSF